MNPVLESILVQAAQMLFQVAAAEMQKLVAQKQAAAKAATASPSQAASK